VASVGFLEVPRGKVPAAWVERYLDRAGGWQLAPATLVDQMAALGAPAPLVLIPRRQGRKLNASLDFLGERAEVLLHPDDARESGVVDGQAVLVRSERGQLSVAARVDRAIRRGAASIPHGHYETNINLLTNKDDIDPITGMVRYSGVPVRVEPAAPPLDLPGPIGA
jgi:formylmethanofuran dehydrogenase subunit D